MGCSVGLYTEVTLAPLMSILNLCNISSLMDQLLQDRVLGLMLLTSTISFDILLETFVRLCCLGLHGVSVALNCARCMIGHCALQLTR